ncbi:MAG: sugar phosphate isomerase/epimerase, partial [Lentisphaeria bacterium]|nr:sugar phosphate isomerase/epimerase [Lentisphaeria bacterium]
RWDLNSPYEAERPALTARLKAVMEIVASLGQDTMAIHMGTDLMAPELPAQVHFDRSCAMLESILPTAERLGITICIENGMIRNYRTPNLLAILEKFKSDNLGFWFDSGLANVMDNGRYFEDCFAKANADRLGEETEWETMAEKMEKMLPYVVNCHLHDNNGRNDQHTLPGRGSVDWAFVTNQLRKAPKLRVIQSEVHPTENQITVAELVKTFDTLFR